MCASGPDSASRRWPRAADISSSPLSRLELAQSASAAVRTYAVLFALLGHALQWQAYPDASPIRDAGQAGIVRRFAPKVPPVARFRTEVGLRRRGALRAWDAELRFPDGRCVLDATRER